MIKKAFLFPGQGSQYIGMGKKLFEEYEVAKKTFEEADEALGFSLSKLCFDGDIEELTKTENAQPAILTVSVAMFRILSAENLVPDILAGHSLGEISALTCAGALPFPEAVKLARKRGELMQEAVPAGAGTMAAVMTRDIEHLKEICEKASAEGVISIANYNTRTQQVISGDVNAVQKAVELLDEERIKNKILNVSGPFHCRRMKPAAEEFEKIVTSMKFGNLKYPVLSNVNALPYKGTEDIPKNLTAQIYSPVLWADSMTYLKRFNTNYCVEVGPGHVLKNMMKTNISDIPVFSFDQDQEALQEYVEHSFFPFVSRAMGIAVATRNTNWDEEAYRNGVITPYNEMKELQDRIEREERKATAEEMKAALEDLLKIFATKGTSEEEQDKRLKELFGDSGQEREFHDFNRKEFLRQEEG